MKHKLEKLYRDKLGEEKVPRALDQKILATVRPKPTLSFFPALGLSMAMGLAIFMLVTNGPQEEVAQGLAQDVEQMLDVSLEASQGFGEMEILAYEDMEGMLLSEYDF